MATIIIDVQSTAEAHRVVSALRLMKCVKRVSVQENDFECIQGLPYTHKERMIDILRAEEDYTAGRTCTSDELKKKITTW